jgi:hypothetical protein
MAPGRRDRDRRAKLTEGFQKLGSSVGHRRFAPCADRGSVTAPRSHPFRALFREGIARVTGNRALQRLHRRQSARCGFEALEPGQGLELLEGVASLGDERVRILGASVCREPLGVLELRDGEVEDEAVLAEDASGRPKVLVDLFLVSSRVDARTEAVAVRSEGGGELARLERLDAGEQICGLGQVVEVECALERFDQTALDVAVGDPELAAKDESAFGGGERLDGPALSTQQPRLDGRKSGCGVCLFCFAADSRSRRSTCARPSSPCSQRMGMAWDSSRRARALACNSSASATRASASCQRPSAARASIAVSRPTASRSRSPVNDPRKRQRAIKSIGRYAERQPGLW